MAPEIQWANLPAQPIGANDLIAVLRLRRPRTYPHRARQRRWLHPPSHTQTARHIDQQVGQQAGNRDGRGRVPFKFRWRRYSSHRRAPDRCPGRGLRASCIAPSTPRACHGSQPPPGATRPTVREHGQKRRGVGDLVAFFPLDLCARCTVVDRCPQLYETWRPQGDSNPRYRRERAMS